MSDVSLEIANDSGTGTSIQAKPGQNFGQAYILLGDAHFAAYESNGGEGVDGLRGWGSEGSHLGGRGVYGKATVIGVEGAGGNVGVSGLSLSQSFGSNSGIGVLGTSDRNRAGVFTGAGVFTDDRLLLSEDKDIEETLNSSEIDPHMHPAQLRLVPYNDNPMLPVHGLAGDFFAVMGLTDFGTQVLLWFCVKSHGHNPQVDHAVWVQIALSTSPGTRRNGGDLAT